MSGCPRAPPTLDRAAVGAGAATGLPRRTGEVTRRLRRSSPAQGSATMSIDRVWHGLAASTLQRAYPMPGKPTRLPTLGRMPAHPLIPYAETTISRDARGQCRRCATMERQSLKVQGNELVERFKE